MYFNINKVILYIVCYNIFNKISKRYLKSKNIRRTNKNMKNNTNSKPLIIANTKSYIANLKSFYKLQDSIWQKLEKENYTYMCAVPSSLIYKIEKEEYRAFTVGAQNFETTENGAFTGANTFENILEAGARFVIVGHSETREMSDNDDLINLKVRKTISNNFTTILCVGEKERVGDVEYVDFIKNQLKQDLKNIDKNYISKLIIAYEPLWAIGAAKAATSDEAQEAIIIIRRTLVDMFGIDNAKKVKVIYGGSVDADNAKRFVSEATADGVLVGRACMDANKFAGIVNSLNSND